MRFKIWFKQQNEHVKYLWLILQHLNEWKSFWEYNLKWMFLKRIKTIGGGDMGPIHFTWNKLAPWRVGYPWVPPLWATGRLIPRATCLWWEFRSEFCQPTERRKAARSLLTKQFSMTVAWAEVFQILLDGWDIEFGSILPKRIETFLVAVRWFGRL